MKGRKEEREGGGGHVNGREGEDESGKEGCMERKPVRLQGKVMD